MRTQTLQKTIKTTCGKMISFLQTLGDPLVKAHSTEGPAIIYPESEETLPEYYIHGVKHSKAQWKEYLAHTKVTTVTDPIMLDQRY